MMSSRSVSSASHSHSRVASQSSSRPTAKTTTTGSRPTTTTRTGQTATTAATDVDRHIVAVISSRSVGQDVGLALLHQQHGRLTLSQFADSAVLSKTVHLLGNHNPSILLVTARDLGIAGANKAEGEHSLLVKTLRDAFPDAQLVPVGIKYWDKEDGKSFVQDMIIDNNERTATILQTDSKYYSLCAAAALFHYLENALACHFPPQTVAMSFITPEGRCLIDADTVTYLELVAPASPTHSLAQAHASSASLICSLALAQLKNAASHPKASLYGLLNQSLTAMGARLIRANVLSPLTDVDQLNERLDAVSDLIEDERRLNAVTKALGPLKSVDCDKLVGHLASGKALDEIEPVVASLIDPAKESSRKIGQVFDLRRWMATLSAVRASLHGTETKLLQKILDKLSTPVIEDILKLVEDTINSDVIHKLEGGQKLEKTAKIYAVRSEKNRFLDVARATLEERTEEINDLHREIQLKHNFVNLSYHAQTGYIFHTTRAALDHRPLPAEFSNEKKMGRDGVEFNCLELKQINARYLEAMSEVLVQSNGVLDELLLHIREKIGDLFAISDALAVLDMIQSFATVANSMTADSSRPVRPEFHKSLAIKNGRHPLWSFLRKRRECVPNDTFSMESSSFQIITGPNMSGKSFFLRQVALMQIMAQIGCFLPATYASVKIVDAVLSKLGMDDSFEDGLSSFGKEMYTMSMILSALSTVGHSLVIIDELGRGTSPEEAVGLCHAIACRIIRAKATCFFATHFKELAVTLRRYPNVVTQHLAAEIERGKSDFSMTFHHQLKPGVTPLAHYGVELLKAAKLPEAVLKKACDVSHRLDELESEGKKKLTGEKTVTRRKVLMQLRDRLALLGQAKHLSAEEIYALLERIRDETVEKLASTVNWDDDDRSQDTSQMATAADTTNSRGLPTTSDQVATTTDSSTGGRATGSTGAVVSVRTKRSRQSSEAEE